MSYEAVIAAVKVVPHPNADRLQIARVAGHSVVVGLDVRDGDVGVFFPPDGQLSDEMCRANSLYPVYNDAGDRVGGGFFDANRRVRAQKFRGVRSEGYWAPLSSLAWTGHALSDLSVGDTFTSLNGKPVCNKYVNERTLRMAGGANKAKAKKRPVLVTFPEHYSTANLRYNAHAVPAGSDIVVTEKLHGTSQRFGRVWIEREQPWYTHIPFVGRFLRKEGSWEPRTGTRRVILGTPRDTNGGHYGSHAFRFEAQKAIEDACLDGEVWYFEVVGYAGDKPIMPPHSTDKVGDKAFRKCFGRRVNYVYGCAPSEQRVFVYRIARVGKDGTQRDLPWDEMTARCEAAGVQTVPVWQRLRAPEDILAHVEALVTPCPGSVLAPSQPIEGLCVRVEDPERAVPAVFKYKTFEFLVMEGVAKDAGAEDIEEAS